MSGIPTVYPHSERRTSLWTILQCALASAAVSAVAILCAWNGSGRSEYLWLNRNNTIRSLEILRSEINTQFEKTGKLPQSLSDLPSVKEGHFLDDGNGHPSDAWLNPLLYEVKDGSYVITSLGEDGKPGGSGIDADLTATGAGVSVGEFPTLSQFLSRRDTHVLLWSCGVSGLFVFPVCLILKRRQSVFATGRLLRMIAFAVTALFAIGTALVIGTLHLEVGFH
jgi:hypothetical protein